MHTTLYALKPWYGRRLAGIRRVLVAWRVSPHAVTAACVGCGAVAGAALATLRPGLWLACVVTVALAARLAAANLDGAIARERGRTSRAGSVLNELGDRLAELATLAGCLVLAPGTLVVVAAGASLLPSWVSLAGAAAGAPRLQGGPAGKTERCVLLVGFAASGSPWWLVALATGALLTAIVRLVRLCRRDRATPQLDATVRSGPPVSPEVAA
ncbi:CDP-alcohol phosphatidyltransferase family protein [Lipingzhangella sp. LS1_29]|uniref:CDP-alcohol phosphatidyltransferase family protein n=1 Tax=Lipingzhangella rawalii TaxID=2055835 RepID=A0ABU2H2J2_9ACTN|nr:CDP-alcohol phosphatidyltransferase family protein [Lipingzhangella rawalii]MDS1269516.1 CDP-alcohol phosphatidyltransferase family protein [Lipingzhangella rawalii]